MSVRLQTSGYNLHGELFKLYLLDSTYGGSAIDATGSGEGWTLKYDGDSSNHLSPIIASEARMFIRVTADNLTAIESIASDLLNCAEGRFMLKIMRSSGGPSPVDELFWVGYVLNDLSKFSDESRYEYTFTATDGLARLKGIEYKDTTGLNYQPFGNLTMLEHLLYCLNRDTLSADFFGGSDVFLRTVINWQDSNIGSPAATKCPLAHTRVQGFVFAEQQESDDPDFLWKYKSCYDVIKIICEHWAARIYFSFGSYRIEQIGERDQDTFYERRFSKSGGLISSTASAGYDKEINQNIVGSRLATGDFSYLAPFKKVDVFYEHNTFRNYLSGNGNYWYYNSPFTIVTIQPVTVDADTFFRVSGAMYLNVDLIADYADVGWWRHVAAMQIFIGGKALQSHTTAATGPGGNLIPVVMRTPMTPQWVTGADNYEISSEFQASEHLEETVTFAFDTPVVPAGTSIQISFTSLGAKRLDGTSEPVIINDWRVTNPVFGIINSGQNSTFFEKRRLYNVLNSNSGNSEVITYNSIFGHAVKGWTGPKLQTSSNGLTWADTTASWHYGSGVTALEFGKLLATEIMAGQVRPLQRYSGSIFGNQTYAHSRIVFPDDTAWLMLSIEYSGKRGIWTGDWMRAGSNRASVSQGPTVKIGGGGKNSAVDPPGFVAINPGSSSGQTGSASLPMGGNLGLNIMAINYIGANINAGTITSIPLQYAAEGNCLFAGDVLNIYNPTTGQIIDVTIAADVNAGDTSISITSTALTDDILNGSFVFLGLVNHYTAQGGGGGNMPPGAAGQILVHDGDGWAPYSGSTDGHVLTWDTSLGWQGEAPGGNSFGNQAANTIFAGPVSGSPAAPAFRTLVTADVPNSAITYQKIQNIATQRVLGRNSAGTGTVEEVSGTQIVDWLDASPVQGCILYRNATAWVMLQPGISGRALLSGGPLANPAWATSTHLTGNGVSGYVPYFSSASVLTYDSGQFFYDATNKRLGVGTSSPQGVLHGGLATGSSGTGLYIAGNISGNLNNVISNVNNVNTGANTILTLSVGGANAGDAILQLQAGSTWSVGVDNSDSDAFVIAQSSAPGTANKVRIATTGQLSINTAAITAMLTVYGSGTSSSTYSMLAASSIGSIAFCVRDDRRVGILTTTPAYELDVAGASRSNVFFNTLSVPTVQLGAGAGSGSGGTVGTIFGTRNACFIAFTTGTSVTAGGTIITVTPSSPFPNLMFPVFCAGNNQTATDISKFMVSTAGNTSFVITANGSLSTSTTYQLYFSFFGY